MALESAPRMAVLTDPGLTVPVYAETLGGWWRVVAALQPVTDAALGATSPERRWLRSDLQALGVEPLERTSLTPMVTPAEALGYRYVIESHHVHARLLAPSVRATLGEDLDAFRFLTAHDGATHTWRSTMIAIDEVPSEERRSVLIGARAALAALHRTLGGW